MSGGQDLVKHLRGRIRELSRELKTERELNDELRDVAIVGTGMLLGLDERRTSALRRLYPDDEPVSVDTARDLLDEFGLLDGLGA